MVFAAAFQASAPLLVRPPSLAFFDCAAADSFRLNRPPAPCFEQVLPVKYRRSYRQQRSSWSTTLFGLPPSSPRQSDGKDSGESRGVDRKRNNETMSAEYLRSELNRVEEMEEILQELEEFYLETSAVDDQEVDDDEDSENGVVIWTEQRLSDIFGDIPDDDDDDFDNDFGDFDYDDLELFENMDDDDDDEEDRTEKYKKTNLPRSSGQRSIDDSVAEAKSEKKELYVKESAVAILEQALLQGVVPVSANVGSDQLPGDFGFDPLNLATKDYIGKTQQFIVNLLPEREDDLFPKQQQRRQTQRPKALILRDYREAEIRHGRLAMLAAMFWPLQEMLDQLLLDENLAGPLIYGPVTLPYFPLFMTLIMLLLGYLDIYSQAIKDRDSIGEAFLPGDCFWDPLRVLEGAPDSMKRNMQERELFNGRVAMIAFAVFTWEEAITHLPLSEVEGNELLLRPLYQVPYVQEWLDYEFSPSFEPPEATSVMDSWGSSSTLQDMLQEGAEDTLGSVE